MTTASPQHVRLGKGVRAWRAFRQWRRSRPFWGGLFTLLAGLEIFATTQLSLNGLRFQMGPTGFLAWLIPTILAACGLFIWFTPQHRMFYAMVAAVTSVYSLIGVNLGGFFIGLLLGMVGSALGFAWVQVPPKAGEPTDDGGTTGAGDGGESAVDDPTAVDGVPVADTGPTDDGAAEPTGVRTSHLLTDTLPQPRNPLTEETDPRWKPTALAILLIVATVSAAAAVAVRSTPAYAEQCPPAGPPTSVPTTAPTSGSQAPQPSASGDGTDQDGSPVRNLVDGIIGLLSGGDPEPSPTAEPTPSASPTPATTTAPPTAPPTAPSPKPSGCPPRQGDDPSPGKPGLPPGVKHLTAAAGQPRVAEPPSVLTGSKLTMENLRIDGVVDLPTADGTIRVLQFSMKRAVTTDFRMQSPGPDGMQMVYATKTLTISGDVKFYAARFVGRLLGMKITLTPDSPLPPGGIPLPLPIPVSFDDPEIRLVYVDCNELTARPQLKLSRV